MASNHIESMSFTALLSTLLVISLSITLSLQDSVPQQWNHARLELLPTGILLVIAEHLSPPEIAALTLTCRSMFFKLGNTGLKHLRKDPICRISYQTTWAAYTDLRSNLVLQLHLHLRERVLARSSIRTPTTNLLHISNQAPRYPIHSEPRWWLNPASKIWHNCITFGPASRMWLGPELKALMDGTPLRLPSSLAELVLARGRRVEFLCLLARDDEKVYFCEECEVLHSRAVDGWRVMARKCCRENAWSFC